MNRKKLISTILILFTVLLSSIIPSQHFCLAENTHTLTILHTNDIHGRLKPINYRGKNNVGGFAGRAQIIKKIKSENKNILVLDAGDIAQGTLFFKFFEGVPDVKFMSEVGYDAAELGNHEFDKGLPVLKKMIDSASFPFLCSNIRFLNKPEMQNKIKPYIIKEYNGFKVIVIGVISRDLKTLVANYTDFEVIEPTDAVKTILGKIKSKIDLIIILSHSGIEEDIKLAKAVPEINIIVGGHSHTLLKYPKRIFHGKKSTLIVQAGEFGVNLGRLDLNFDNKNIEKYSYKMLPIEENQEETVFSNKISELSRQINVVAQQIIGKTQIPLDIRNNKLKTQLTNGGVFVLKTIKAQYPYIDIVFVNAGAIRSNKIIPAGLITKEDVFELYPFDDNIVIAEITGREIKSMLETSLRSFPKASSGFLQSLGIEYTINTTNPSQILSKDELSILRNGKRISNIKIGKTPLIMDKYYKIAVSEYIFNGGNGYSQFKNSKNIIKTEISVQNAIIDYLKKNSPIFVEVEDRINLY